MIVKMKKATMLCLHSDKESALDKLRDLGVMHVELENRVESDDIASIEQVVAKIDRAAALLSARVVKDSSQKQGNLSGLEICNEAIEIVETDVALKKVLDELVRDRDRLAPWGEFSQDLVADLRAKDVHVYLCAATKEDIAKLPEHVSIHDIHEEGGEHYFLLISHDEMDEQMLPLANIPEGVSLSELNSSIAGYESKIMKNEARLDDLVHYIGTLEEYQKEIHEELEFTTNRDGMIDAGTVVHMTGYVPAPAVDELTQSAKDNGWGILVVEPASDDAVPTYVKVPKMFSASKPIFDFIGISPGYNEVDISSTFLVFFTIFFGMIIGDGGYGAIFLGLSLFAMTKATTAAAKRTVNLFTILSVATVGWGFLTGNFFGVVNSAEALAAGNFQWPAIMGGVEWFKNDQHIQLLCFMIAIVHLSIAHGWKLILQINTLKAVGEIGWLGLIWGAFFVIAEMVVKMPILPMADAGMYLIGPGLLLMLLFSVDWTDIGDILNFPFGALGGFVDLLSYIRLFAVGLSGYYVAVSFNQLGYGMFEAFPGGMVVGVLVIVFGHMLNIALCAMGVLVHGIRLNTLEFSGHLDLEWAGFVFAPFKKLINK